MLRFYLIHDVPFPQCFQKNSSCSLSKMFTCYNLSKTFHAVAFPKCFHDVTFQMLSRCCLSKMFSRYSLSKMFSHYSLSKYFHVAGSHCPGFIVSFYPGVLHTRVQRPSLSLILHFQLTCYVLPTYNSHLLTKFSFQDWMDYQLHWNVTEYGGVESIRIHPKLIWTPDLLMYNR